MKSVHDLHCQSYIADEYPMPTNNFRFIILAISICVYCCARVTYRELVLLYSMRQVEALALVEPDEKVLFEGAMQGMFAAMDEKLGDEYSTYISPDQDKTFREMLDSRIEGIGVSFDPTAEAGTFKVLYPLLGSPAHNAGIRAGDTILKVDGKKTDSLKLDTLSEKIKGPAGTEVVLTVRHRDEETPVDIRIRRATIQQNTVFGFGVDSSGKPIATVPGHPDIAYAYIASFNDNTSQEFLRVVETLPQGVDKLILDLRANPGGYLKPAVEIADFFVDDRGPYREIVTTKMKNGVVKYPSPYLATAGKVFDGKVVLLIDDGSASASEILAACLQDFERAKVLGERSYGKGTVQEIFNLPFNSHFGKIKLTDATYWRPSGRNINRVRSVPESESHANAAASSNSGGGVQTLSGNADDWGVGPDPGLELKLSRSQKMLTYFLRNLRTSVPEKDGADILERFTTIFTKNPSEFMKFETDPSEDGVSQDNIPEEQRISASKEKAVRLEGKAPYYDPVLDKAIEVLRQGDSGEKRKRTPASP